MLRTVDVEITGFALREVFIGLGRSFSLFPNLHTVKIIRHQSRRFYDGLSISAQTAWRRGFQRRDRYPQVLLSPVAYPLLEACPNLRSFEADTAANFGYLLDFLRFTPDIQRVLCSRRFCCGLCLSHYL